MGFENEDSWEPLKNLKHAPDALATFYQRLARRQQRAVSYIFTGHCFIITILHYHSSNNEKIYNS